MSRKPAIHRLTEDEWNELSLTADEASALATLLDVGCLETIHDERMHREVVAGCVGALRRILNALVDRLNELEPQHFRTA